MSSARLVDNTPAGEPASQPARTLALCTAAQAIGGGLGWSSLPPVMGVVAQDLHLSPAMTGVVWGAASLGIALASPFGGAAVDRHGPRRVGAIALFAGALACAARALAQDGWTLALTMLLFGLHIGFVAPALPKALAGHIPLARLASANGQVLLGYTLGTAATMLTARTLLLPLVGGSWRVLMLIIGGAMALLAGAFWLLLGDRGGATRHASLRATLALLGHAGVRRVAAMHFLLFGGYLALLGLLPRALGARGLSAGAVGLSIAGWLVVAGLANALGPRLSDRLGRRRPFLLGGGLVAGLALAGVAFLPGTAGTLCLVVAALGGGVVAPLLLTLPLELPGVGPARAGMALGLLMLVGQLGGFLLPVLTGVLTQQGGFPLALMALAAAHLLIVVPALRFEETGAARNVPAPTTSLVGRSAKVSA